MLLRSVRSERSQIEREANRDAGPEGQARMEASQALQMDLQRDLSRRVLEHGALTDEQIIDWEDSLSDRYSSTVVSVKNTYNRRRYVAVDGKWVPTFDPEEFPEIPKPKCFRPLFESE